MCLSHGDKTRTRSFFETPNMYSNLAPFIEKASEWKDDTILKLSFKFMERSLLRYRQLTRVKQPISFHNINTEHEV